VRGRAHAGHGQEQLGSCCWDASGCSCSGQCCSRCRSTQRPQPPPAQGCVGGDIELCAVCLARWQRLKGLLEPRPLLTLRGPSEQFVPCWLPGFKKDVPAGGYRAKDTSSSSSIWCWRRWMISGVAAAAAGQW
jgi:hypothetical protein